MFKLLSIISNVKYHIIVNNDNDLIYLKENTLYANDIPILYGNNVFDFNAYGKTVYIAENGMVNFKNYENNFQTKFNKSASVSFINENEALLYYGSDDYLKNYVGRFDIFNKSFKWEIERFVGRGLIVNNYLYSGINNTFISKIDLNHPTQPLWQFDLSQLGTYSNHNNETQNYKVEKILGIHNERLYLGLSGSLILELNIATGDITYQWHHLPQQFVKHPSDGFSARYFDLDTKNNQLICLAGRRYDTIDLTTKTYNSVDITKELELYDIVSIRHQGDFTNEHISAISHLKNDTWFQDGIVMFNRKTKKVDFFYKDETFTTGTDTPRLAKNELYQLDADSNLYIFEKDQNAIT